MQSKLALCLSALLCAGFVSAREFDLNQAPEGGLRTLLKEPGAPEAPPSVQGKTVSASQSPLHAVLVKIAELQRALREAHSSGLKTPSVSDSMRWMRVPKRWDSDEYAYYAALEPVHAVGHDELMDYYAREVRALVQSNEAQTKLTGLLLDESENPGYSAEERRALKRAALALQGLDQRAEDSRRLVEAYRSAAHRLAELPGSEVAIENPESLSKLSESAEGLLEANGRAAERAAAVIRLETGDFGGPILVISKDASPEQAREALSKALGEDKTTFLLIRSLPGNEVDAAVLAGKAAHMAARENPAEWRVVWIRNQDLLPKDVLRSYFGDDEGIAAASLRWGTGEPREAAGRFAFKQLDDNIAVGKAFAEAGPKP